MKQKLSIYKTNLPLVKIQSLRGWKCLLMGSYSKTDAILEFHYNKNISLDIQDKKLGTVKILTLGGQSMYDLREVRFD